MLIELSVLICFLDLILKVRDENNLKWLLSVCIKSVCDFLEIIL